MAGALDGVLSVEHLLEHGDFGLGTFEGLDGEMTIADGRALQAKSDGSVHDAHGRTCAFACICRFSADGEKRVTGIESIAGLETQFASLRASENAFYALRADGDFSEIHMRAVCRSHAGLLQAASTQTEFECSNISGTIVGVWTPAYAGALNVPGYHLHFVSADRSHVGHVLLCSASSLHLQVQRLNEYHLVLPETPTFASADLHVSPEQLLQIENLK